ncbi:MAG TPA: oligosaccharide flippase family protein [Candidatus Woesebacteria bacterium]|nr:oligosaccharide flippase family protein [Candidatus Woesebacteria bacterium]
MNIKTLMPLRSIIKHPLISGSSIAFIGSFCASILAYLFNLAMIRMLSVSDYGLLTALTSLVTLFGIFQVSLVGIFAKFSAKYQAKSDDSGFSQLYLSGLRFVLFISVIIGILLTVLIPILSSFFKISDYSLIIIVIFSIMFSIISAFPLGVLQGKMRFWMTSLLYILAPVVKILVGVSLVSMGYNILGVLIAILLASLTPSVIGIFLIKRNQIVKKIKKNEASIFFREFRKYSLHYFLASLGITIITNADIMLVRAFFDPNISGQYAALSLMGKAIFYFTSPIYFVFFPLIAQKNERKENYTKILLLTISLVLCVTGSISIFYFLFPQIVLAIFAPREEYKALIPYIGMFSLYMLVFSIANIFNHLFLSINKGRVFIINLFTALVFVISIVYFHESLQQVITILLMSSSLLLLLYLLYYYRVSHGKN